MSGVNLNEREAAHMARRLVARLVLRQDEWLEWEDLPMLGELAFERLSLAVERYGRQLLEEQQSRDRLVDIDTALLIEKAEA